MLLLLGIIMVTEAGMVSLVITHCPSPGVLMRMLFSEAFFQTACAFGPHCLLHVIITCMRRVALSERGPVLSTTPCLCAASFLRRGLFWSHSLQSSRVGCRFFIAGGSPFFVFCSVQFCVSRRQGLYISAVGNPEVIVSTSRS